MALLGLELSWGVVSWTGARGGEELCVRAARPPPGHGWVSVLESMGREERGMETALTEIIERRRIRKLPKSTAL